MKKIILAICFLFGVSTAFAQQTQMLKGAKSNEYGIVYHLPVTNLQITLTAERTVGVPGPFYQYAKKAIGSENPVVDESVNWRIIDVAATTYGTANAKESYLMQLKPKSLTYVGVANDGMLLSINTPPATPYRPSEAMGVQSIQEVPGVVVRHAITDYLQYVTEDFLTSVSKGKQAELLAEILAETREEYHELSTGASDNQPESAEALDIMLATLERKIEAITEAFNGYTYSERVSRSYTYTPTSDGRSVLCRLSDFDGFTDASDYAGAPIHISTKVTQRASIPRDAEGEPFVLPKDAVIYRIPGEAAVTISYEGEDLYRANFAMSQFGVNFGLNPKLFTDKKAPSQATFDAATGALIEVSTAKP